MEFSQNEMIQKNSSITDEINANEYEYNIPNFKKKEKVLFELLPFMGFNDTIEYYQLTENNNEDISKEETDQNQPVLNSSYNQIEYIPDANNECPVNSSSECCRESLEQNNEYSSNYSTDNEDISSPQVWKKTRIRLNEQALTFKESFYHLFTFKKKFPKKYVVLIHNYICHQIGIRRINREESRSIDKYFQHFAHQSDIIIKYIQSVPVTIWVQLVPSLFKPKNNTNNLSKF